MDLFIVQRQFRRQECPTFTRDIRMVESLKHLGRQENDRSNRDKEIGLHGMP